MKIPTLPETSPVKITVTASGGARRRSIGLTSPIRRSSLSPLSSGNRYSHHHHENDTETDTVSDEFVSYTVQIPPTPERHSVSDSGPGRPVPGPDTGYIAGTIFTGGFNSVTRSHVIDYSTDRPESKPGNECGMKGCDEAGMTDPPCECGFKLCRDCHVDCLSNGGRCLGCKEVFTEAAEAEDKARPLPSMAELRADNRRLSLVKSVKNPPEFDHNRWLFETKGTYGYGNAVWPKDGFGFGAGVGCSGFENPPDFGEKCRKPLTRKVSVSAAVLSPYRLLMVIRLVALGLYLTWRVKHPNHEAMWLWGMSVTCEIWFAFSWLLDQLPKMCPVNRLTDLSVLKDRYESLNLRNPKGRSDLPGIDVFVSTADPEKEPPLVTANTILSILAVDYPVEKLACYLSDDGGALLTFEAMAETASFARTWVPFCRKHGIEPRNPEAYFAQKKDPFKNKVKLDFVRERRRVKREYDEFKVRINSLPESIRRRSDAYNAHEELRAKKKQMETGDTEILKVQKATWMSDGSHWPGTWASAEPDHSRGDHAGIIQAMLAPPNSEPVFGSEADGENLIDTTKVDVRLPMLVYVSREKRPGYDHNKKAGAMNALVRTSAIMSNGPFILNLDCDHYIYNSLALREGMCFMLDRGGDRICYVQFPQRFEGIDPNDRYANHNTVFFDVSMRALDGLQGPMYVGTGCVFRRIALYGFSPPRATEHHGWFGSKKLKLLLRQSKKVPEEETKGFVLPVQGDHDEDDDLDIESLLLPKRFGNSTSLAVSIPVAEYSGRLHQDLQGKGTNGRPAGSLAVPREPLDAATVAEAISVISCFYEDRTEWGKRVGWIYGSVTEDVVTGYRMHNRGWRSIYCVTKRDAFRGTAPINLTDRLHQVLRWATGSVEIFFSKNNALFASRRMKFLQRIAYINVGLYPFTSLFLLVYCFLPAVSLFSGQFIVQSLSVTFLVLLLTITLTLCMLALLEIRWSGITLHDWWRNEQFWLIGGTSAHPAAVLQGLLKVIGGVDISFTLTSKSGTPDDIEDEFADLYVVKWSFLMLPPITIMMVNMIAIGVGAARTLYSPFPEWSKLLGGVFFSFWVLLHLYPFAKGLMGRRGRVPTIVFLWSGLLSIIISLLWVFISPPSGSQENVMKFQFP
ncbi:hypothetical protein RND81_04G089900 [Saponaria officinalis]|uniref:Cellulose synthase-like protein D5 n=1 Tax=Saponaria officinalis TaxID=3572 RepID=A0AAW1LJP0_SAPOF